MLVAPIPHDEAERLADLKALRILDTPEEERFDRIVKLACDIFEVPVAYLALVDSDRQWFKAQCGLGTRQTGRSESFCSHAILENDLLVVPDTTLDERFHDNPLVVGKPHVRFYAGHPISGPQGHHVGTFCLVDHHPRSLTAQQIALLRKLAALAEHELNLMDVIQTQKDLLNTQNELLRTQHRLSAELQEAAGYVRSLLPEPLTGSVSTRWLFISSSQLGGDIFGHHWLDDDHLVLYLIDVCGHGVGPSLLSITLHNALRHEALSNVDFGRPAEVLDVLNHTYPMADSGEYFFTVWYGVYSRSQRRLRFGCAGHHPAVLIEPGSGSKQHLVLRGLPAGIDAKANYEESDVHIAPGSRLYLFSDGAFEIDRPDGAVRQHADLVHIIEQAQQLRGQRLEHILKQVRTQWQAHDFADDYSMLEVEFEQADPMLSDSNPGPGHAAQVRLAESDADIRSCCAVMRQLRPHIAENGFVDRVRQQQTHGYRLAYVEVGDRVVAVAGFRISQYLAWGRAMYVDDLVTDAAQRSRGYGRDLLEWLKQHAVQCGCAELHLDSGVQRKDAHRFYHRHDLKMTSHHFMIDLR